MVVLLPPPPNQPKQQTGFTLLFRRDSLAPQLLRPVTATLSHTTPSVQSVERAPDASNVERLANPLYIPSLTQGNAALTLYLVLKPYVPTNTSSGR